jgi:hypothetical protein
LTSNDVSQAVTVLSGSASPALRAAIDRLAEAHAELEKAQKAVNAANDLYEAGAEPAAAEKQKR